MTRRSGLVRHAVGLALVGCLCLGPSLLVTPALADEPKLTPQQEWEAHPELVKAIFYRLQMDDAAIDKAQVK